MTKCDFDTLHIIKNDKDEKYMPVDWGLATVNNG